MNVPNLPHIDEPITLNGKNINPQWYRAIEQLFTQLQQNLSEEGLSVPQQSTGNISILQASTPKPSILYNKETHQPLISVNGVYKVIQTS